MTNRVGELKHHSILKELLHLLQNIKCNVWGCPLEIYVSNHRKSHDDVMECSTNIQCAVPGHEKRVQNLINSIKCTYSTLQAAIDLFRSNANNMREDFESLSSSLIKVDPWCRSSHSAGLNADVSSIDFKAVSVYSGVDLRCHPKERSLNLSKHQRDELSN